MSVVLRRAVLSTVVAIGVVTASGAIGLGRGSTAPASQDNSGFPDGDSKKLVLDNCGGCHDLDQVKTAKHNEAAWKETLSHMVTYGANLTEAQVPTVAAYLAKAFPVQGTSPATPPAATPPAGTPPATPPGTPPAKPAEDPDAAGERILNTACTTCHDLGPIVRRADDRAAWESVVYGMVGNGADVKDADIPVLVNYLFKTYGPPKEAPKGAPAPAGPAAPAGGGRGARGQ
jgi:cytochrome c5